MSPHHSSPSVTKTDTDTLHFALVGSPNAGKTTLFNSLTGLHAKTGNYPGVTVARYEGMTKTPVGDVVIEDLPGTYSLDPISPDEVIVTDVVDPHSDAHETPDALLVVLDATTLRRSLSLLAHVQHTHLPMMVVLTFTDELARRQGKLDIEALRRALNMHVVAVTAGNRNDVAQLRTELAGYKEWPQPVIDPPTEADEVSRWADSILAASHYQAPKVDARTHRIDRVLLHPVWGVLFFLLVMFSFFQIIFTVAAPMQDAIEAGMGWLGGTIANAIGGNWVGRFLNEAIIGGIGGVLVFLPQIILLFVMISIMEGTGYMSRAAFLMDRVMAKAGLEGRAFVALLSSLACAIPGIMATRSLPSARDRLATMMAAPLMTCSARLPVYVMLIALLVPQNMRVGFVSVQGLVMFGLYLLGAIAAMTTAWFFKRITGRNESVLPFYMEVPSYRWPSLKTVAYNVWEASKAFLQKVTSIILLTTVVLWIMLNLPLHGDAELRQAGIDPTDDVAVSSYVIDNSLAASVGNAVEPVFEPLGFDWRINVGVLSSLAAREVFVATLGQIAAAEDPENPIGELQEMTVTEGPRAGEKLFDAPTITALLLFFVFALQCMSTMGVMRRETGGWKWPLIAFTYMGVTAWVIAFIGRTIVAGLI